MTVTSLLLLYRDALRALVPFFDQLGLPWREPDAYDEWDELASLLYRHFVVGSLLETSVVEDRETIKVAEYDIVQQSYAGMSYVSVIPLGEPKDRCRVFHSFATDVNPLDRIRFLRINNEGMVLRQDLESCSIDRAAFHFEYLTSQNSYLTVDVLSD